MIDYRYEFDQWLKNENQKLKRRSSFKKKFIGSRGYAHFDTPLDIKSAHDIGVMEFNFTDTDRLLRWRFMPFVRKDQRNRRYRRKPTASPIKHRDQKSYSHVKSRPIMFASHHDACLYSFFGFIINSRYEAELELHKLGNNVLAYRSIKGKNNIDFAKQAFDHLESLKGEWACLLVDISSFFDNVPHEELTKSLLSLDRDFGTNEFQFVLKSLLDYRYVIQDEVIKELKEKKRPYFVPIGISSVKIGKIEDFNKFINNKRFIRKNRSSKGFPQGSPISGLLANVFMMEFDLWLSERISVSTAGLYQRYSDDMLVVCPVEDAPKLYREIKSKLNSYALRLSENKTEVFIKDKDGIRSAPEIIGNRNNSKQRLQYLGLEWDGSEIILRPSTIAKRMRPKNKLAKKYWKYHELAIRKISRKRIAVQYRSIKKTIRSKQKDLQ